MLDNILSLFNNNNDSLTINSEMCPYFASNRFSCQKCIEVCPTHGLKWQNRSWTITECTYCGKCAAVCPTRVFDLDADYLMKMAVKNEKLIITCSTRSKNLPDQFKCKVLDINCLSQLYPELVIFLLASVRQLIIYIEPDKCDRCMQFSISGLYEQLKKYGNFEQEITLISNFEELEWYLQHTSEKADPGMDRRSFLKMLFKGGHQVSHEIIEESLDKYNIYSPDNNIPDDDTLSKTGKRQILYNGIKNLQQKGKSASLRDFLPFTGLTVEQCNFCEVCTRLCPTQALQITTDGNTKSLQYSIIDCTGCGLCQTVCMFGKISPGEQVTIDRFLTDTPVTLASAEAKQCSKCKKYFYCYPDNEELCPMCRTKASIFNK